jgi:outer membrane protein assembly factor BamC
MKRFLPLALALASLALVSGCGIFKTDEQQRAARTREKPLEVPPDLTTPTVDDRFAVPDPKASTSYSQFSRDRATAPSGTPLAGSGTSVLPTVANAHIERGGNQRWIVVKAEPSQVWPIVRSFWEDLGFSIARETPEAGILETNWRDSRAKVEETGFRGVISRALPGMYSTGERDRFRTRLEKGTEPGTTEIYVSHRGLEEVFTNVYEDTTRWQPRGSGTDPDLESEMLGLLLVKLGEPTRTATLGDKPADGKSVVVAGQTVTANAVLQNNGAGPLVVNDGFDRAWRRVGLALDRSGFTVEDRDRTKGTFFVRYLDPDAPAPSTGGGVLDKLAFWRPTEKANQPPYRIVVTDAGGGTSNVVVQNANGETETSTTGKRILSLLLEQLK